MIRLEGVTKTYRGRPALLGVSASVEKGEFVFLTGPSGAGKSTLLRLLYRAEVPDAGRVLVGGRDLTHLNRREVAEMRRRMGVVFQDFKLLRRRTVGENITFVLDLLGLPEREQQRRAYLALRQVGLHHRLSAYPEELSGGEQQRVAVARALVVQPEVILADEPTGNLDPERSHELMDFLREAHYRGTTVVVATHDVSLIAAHPARTLVLDRGRLVRDGWGP
ncbi:MAG: cell division ATP-binding protein FtsE, partial [Thermoanaerobaculum sp.]|nr:cell division ATP-binding protein FtsE [Thermoanaerobaculum sp.]